ncbi:HAD family hydrolase [Dyella japonica]|uniref:Haloacid dehalogenase n=1 Tax=Dyella japonica A8 TaxID=1217721 RepID=A0A075K500_9GAMM|nr:HAD family hydrolase [Dyella japonica]AIF47258.1 hypothetical protein HY57_08190 [Dyella japonica A8]
MQNDGSLPAGPVTCYSFDVFDTCITRTHAYPRDVFYELGLRLAPSDMNSGQKHQFAARFQLLRVRAEKRAHRAARPNRTVTIDDIYKNLSIPKELSAGLDDLMRLEIELERESIYPIPEVIAYIDDLRRSGHRVIFISDMYLSGHVLTPMLRELGVMKDGDTLYVSCDVGLTKHHGELFKHVLRSEGLDASQLVHTGDNLRADVRMARNAGIQANHFRYGMLTSHEVSLAGPRLPRQRARSMQAALLRRLRLSVDRHFNAPSEPLDHLIHGVVVPFLLIYVMWVLDQAKRSGLRRLYFVARDGEIMYRIAQALQGQDDSIELRYLYGSRRAWLPPSILPGSSQWQRLLVIPGQASSRSDIAARMGMNDAQQETVRGLMGVSKEHWVLPLSSEGARTFLGDIQRNESAMEHILAASRQEREIALSYFIQEGLLDGTPWALVDAGWSLNCQAALKRILDASGIEHPMPRGYYLALARDHLSPAQAGVAEPFISKAGSIFSRRRVVIEHGFLPSTHATTKGYRVDGSVTKPVIGPELRNETELNYARRLHAAAISAATLVASDQNSLISLVEQAKGILSGAAQLLQHPEKADALALATFGTVADMRHESPFVQPLCRPLTMRDVLTVISMVLSNARNFKTPSFMWLEGSIALSPWHVRVPLKFLLCMDTLNNWLKDRTPQNRSPRSPDVNA